MLSGYVCMTVIEQLSVTSLKINSGGKDKRLVTRHLRAPPCPTTNTVSESCLDLISSLNVAILSLTCRALSPSVGEKSRSLTNEALYRSGYFWDYSSKVKPSNTPLLYSRSVSVDCKGVLELPNITFAVSLVLVKSLE